MENIFNYIGTFLLTLGSLLNITTSTPIHDGSRTGVRVSYQSYCHPEQGFVIYENEKILFVTDQGEQVLWTQGDIDCYKEKQLTTQLKLNVVAKPTTIPKSSVNVLRSSPIPTQNPDPILTCKSSRCGDTKMHQSQCQSYICCEIGSKWYWSPSKNKCSEDQSAYWRAYYDSKSSTPSKSYTPSTTFDSDRILLEYELARQKSLNEMNQWKQDNQNLQQQLDTNWKDTQAVLDNQQKLKESLQPKTPIYNTWGEYYDAHPGTQKLHQSDQLYTP